MKKLPAYIRLMRIPHYLKNLLIIVPAVFGKKLFEAGTAISALEGFALFCMLSSAVYAFNDAADAAVDKEDPAKSKRPVASGEISAAAAFVFSGILGGLSVLLCLLLFGIDAFCYAAAYLIINILYSLYLKHVPVADVCIIALGFMLRIAFGAAAYDVTVSVWLYLTVMSMSFYLALGKRYGELRANAGRPVLSYYSADFLSRNMYVFFGITLVFYSLWCMSVTEKIPYIMYTVPAAMIICMRYSFDLEKGNNSDPVSILLSDHWLLGMVFSFAVVLTVLIYLI